MVDTMVHTPGPSAVQAQKVFHLARRLRTAVHQANWESVRGLDSELRELLPTLGTSAHWSHDLKVAMSSLQLLHRSALSQCAQASEEMAARLADMGAAKDGWLAYATSGEWHGDTP